jgi:hypothetical protein
MILTLTIQVPIRHLIAHVSNKERLAWLIWLPRNAARASNATSSRFSTDVILHRHSAAREDFLIQFSHRPICYILAVEFNVPKPFTQTSRVAYNAAVDNAAEARELALKLGRSNFEEEIADIEDWRWRRSAKG